MAVDGWTMKVIQLLLEEFGGRAKFGQFKRRLYQKYLVKGGMGRVLDRLYDSNSFLVFEKDERVKYVSVAWEDASICCGYRKRGWDTCGKNNCSKFHVCKSFITGYCVYGSRCLFGHDLENEANGWVSDSLGLSSFSAEEIRTIIFRSHPAVCVKYNTGGCDDDDCPDLHVCSRFMLKKCKAGARCNLEHSLQTTEHNQWVLETFDVEDMYYEDLRRHILVTNIPNTDTSLRSQMTPATSSLSVFSRATAAAASTSSIDTEDYIFNVPSVHQELYTRQSRRNEYTQHLTKPIGVKATDPGPYEYLCETYTWTGVCPKTPNCPRYHSPDRLPYLWLTRNQEDGEWRRVYSSVNTDFEKSFCGLHDVRSFQFNIPGVQNVDFCAMSAKLDGVRQSVKLRRLSTPSYAAATPGTPLNFYTQWVWYRQEHDRRYGPFYPGSLQYTLEEKYLKGQHKYYFEFEELRLMVNTQSSPMVQTNLDTQRATRVIRRPVFMAATSKTLAMSSLLLSEVPTSVLHQVPDHWSAVDHFQHFEFVELTASVPEYTAVQRQFFSTMDRIMHKTTHIFRVQNPGLWDKYCSARRAMTPKGELPKDVKERQLFHGTPTLQAARGICANSFDFRRSGENVGAVWGKGAYFSTTARYSHDYTRAHTAATGDPQRFMFLGKILVGQYTLGDPSYTLGDPSYTKPPERDGLKMYDSCVNDVSNPTIFVIFDLAQSYPEYLIQYTDVSDSRQQPQLRPATSVPSPVATMTVTSPPPSVVATKVPSHCSTAQTPIKLHEATPTPTPTPTANPFVPPAPRAVTPVSLCHCWPSSVRRAQSAVSHSSPTLQSSPSPPNMGVSNDPSPSSSSGARSPLADEQKCSKPKRKKKDRCVIT